MQEEVTRKTIALAIKTAKLDGKVLQAALRKLLQLYRKARDTPHRGKQTLKQLMRHGTGVSNIEITDANIKAFESTAKKYGIDFALKKADDRYLVFFKGRDADVLTAAFREFSKKKLDKERKPSVRRDLAEKKAEAAQTAKRDKVKNMDRGIDRRSRKSKSKSYSIFHILLLPICLERSGRRSGWRRVRICPGSCYISGRASPQPLQVPPPASIPPIC